MRYYIEVHFGVDDVSDVGDDKSNTVTLVGDDLLRVNGVTFLQISGRQFDRITKSFRERGWTHQLTGIGDAADGDNPEALVTLLMAPSGKFPGLIHRGRAEV